MRSPRKLSGAPLQCSIIADAVEKAGNSHEVMT
jgi:hypothetical protein